MAAAWDRPLHESYLLGLEPSHELAEALSFDGEGGSSGADQRDQAITAVGDAHHVGIGDHLAGAVGAAEVEKQRLFAVTGASPGAIAFGFRRFSVVHQADDRGGDVAATGQVPAPAAMACG